MHMKNRNFFIALLRFISQVSVSWIIDFLLQDNRIFAL
jgi:hypothetical protein